MRNMRIHVTHVREPAQAMLESMDKILQQLQNVCSDLHKETKWILDEAQLGLKLRINATMDEKISSLEMRMEAQCNHAHQ